MKNVTKGECQIIEHNWSDTSIVVGDKTILTISIYDEATEDNQEELEQEANANANLIADAFNTYNSCSLSPSELKQRANDYEKRWGDAVVELTTAIGELKQQRDELLEALKKSTKVICSLKLSMLTHPDNEPGSEFDDFTDTAQVIEDINTELIQKIESHDTNR